MKILLANKFYYPRGGDCIYMLELEKLLKKNGHEVAVFAMQHPQTVETPFRRYFPKEVEFSLSNRKNVIDTFCRPLGDKEVTNLFLRLLDDFQPDVVHLSNIHTQLSPVIARLSYEKGIPVVWTIHDLKLLCPRYDCLRNGKTICESCFSDKKNVLKYRCMKNSLPASLLAYIEARKWNVEKLDKYVRWFICPSNFMRQKMIQGGFSESKLVTVNNFLNEEKLVVADSVEKEDFYCYIGRLSHEKGIKTLVQAANTLPYKLKIIGDGVMYSEIKNDIHGNVELAGYKTWTEIKTLIRQARFIVLPSEWYENNPFSIIESLSLGTPVLGANIGGIPELIEENINGILAESGNVNDLKQKIIYCWENFPSIIDSKKIASDAKKHFSADEYYKKLISLYPKSI
ncbi:MAG: glycosyltransferase [Bacteroidales bacterium]|jgi:glycosyltransferase involved in cell wall biosynthesis|nr:glycosyltransferase [Bacteroidales bacterium]